MRVSSLAVAAILGASGCGANVVVDAAATSASSGGTTTSTTSTGAGGSAGACPVLAPNEGEACSSPGLVCQVPLCCGGTATCSGGTWHIVPGPCAQPCPACPGTIDGCAIKAVCVETSTGGPAAIGHCAASPCNDQPLSCACAGTLCGAAGCAEVSGTVLVCNSVGE